MDINNAGGTVGTKKKNRKNNSRKHRRQYRYYGADHSQTLYRSRGSREKNKARRAAQRHRRQESRRDRMSNGKDNVLHKDHRPEEAVILS